MPENINERTPAPVKELTERLATKADVRLLGWMIGFNVAFSALILWRIIGSV
ncbi:MAG: hypothetical protein OXF89_04705 [Rhodospirillaceae bacterium]|nr:hypothetical protein [Rhodospirillaceae bacterium]MCY4067090.1 hypothetical protein [Rhodospirillaceae bacterium]